MSLTNWRWLSSYLLILAVLVLTCGCKSLPGLLEPANDALGILCETRSVLLGAHEALERGDIDLAIVLIRQYLKEHGPDSEVMALLELIETQDDGLVTEPPF